MQMVEDVDANDDMDAVSDADGVHGDRVDDKSTDL